VLRDQSGLKNQSGRTLLGSAVALINAMLQPIANIVVNTIGNVAVGRDNVRATVGSGATGVLTGCRRPRGWRFSGKVAKFECGRSLRLLLLSLMAGLLSGCDDVSTWRQKMTLVVDTPSGQKAGSSVIAVEFRRGSGQYDGSSVHWGIKGEAVAVELGGGRYLFALLKGQSMWARAGVNASYAFTPGVKNVVAGSKSAINLVMKFPKDKPATLPQRSYPLLVTFDDITKPQTVKRVDPKDLAAAFGPGYALKSITLEITDEPVTKGKVEKVLGWWENYKNKQFDGDRYRNADSTFPFANSINRLDLKRD